MKNKYLAIKHVTLLFTYLFILWGFYRLLFQVPDPFDEILVKPFVWLVPVFVLLKQEKRNLESIGVTFKKLFPAIYLGLALGLLFAAEGAILNYVKYKGVNFGANIGTSDLYLAIFISFITAISEEITFRGYFFGRLWEITNSEWKANLISTLCWSLIHLPIAIFDWHLSLYSVSVYFFLTFVFGFGSAFIYGRTRNIASSIVLHVLWAWPIILFR